MNYNSDIVLEDEIHKIYLISMKKALLVEYF